MVTLSYHIRPSGQEVFEAASRQLLIEISERQLTIVLWHRELKKPDGIEVFTGITHWEDEWDQMVLQSEILNIRNLETLVLFNTRRCMPVPMAFFEGKGVKSQLEAIYGEIAAQHLGGDVWPSHELVMVWEVPTALYDLVTGYFERVRCLCLGSALLELGAENRTQPDHGWLVVNGEQACLALWGNHQLLLLKTLTIREPDDLAYHLMLACQQWGIAADQIKWQVAGMVNQDAPLWKSPERFFPHFEPAHLPVETGAEIPGHFFAHLVQFMLHHTR